MHGGLSEYVAGTLHAVVLAFRDALHASGSGVPALVNQFAAYVTFLFNVEMSGAVGGHRIGIDHIEIVRPEKASDDAASGCFLQVFLIQLDDAVAFFLQGS